MTPSGIEPAHCPACGPSTRDALFWSKAGFTDRLCDEHKEAARSQRRLQAQFKRIRQAALTVVRMDERS